MGRATATGPGRSAGHSTGQSAEQESVYAALRTRIVEHSLEPGARISLSAEASRLGVSQTPVREALHRLEGDRLVVRTASRGYQVTPLVDHQRLLSLFEVRLLLEPWAAAEAATARLHNPAAGLREDLAALAAVHGETREDQARRAGLDRSFHLQILQASGNEVLTEAFDRLHAHVHVFRLHQSDAQGTLTHYEHEAILEAIEACDPRAAEGAMRAHLLGTFERLSSLLRADAAHPDGPSGNARAIDTTSADGEDGADEGNSADGEDSGVAGPVAPRVARARLR